MSLVRRLLQVTAMLASIFPPSCLAQDLSTTFLPGLIALDHPNDNAEVSPVEPVVSKPDGPEKRIFGVIPNYRADQTQAVYKPLTARQKFAIARSDSFDLPNYFLLAGYAVQSQVQSGGFGHNGGVTGFAGYYARSVGDQIIGSYVTEAILPSLLHQDPRFFRLGTGSFLRRARHSAFSIFVTKTDGGRACFNFSEVVGNAGVVALTTVYYPTSRSASEGAERLSMALGNDVVSNFITEFWPDIKRHFSHKEKSWQ